MEGYYMRHSQVPSESMSNPAGKPVMGVDHLVVDILGGLEPAQLLKEAGIDLQGIEKRLIAKIGPTGGKLHTGRSRNDQIATDERLYLREAIDEIITLITACQQALYQLAERTIDVIFPGYTHLQQAQPIRFAHYAMAIFSELERDKNRFSDCENHLM